MYSLYRFTKHSYAGREQVPGTFANLTLSVGERSAKGSPKETKAPGKGKEHQSYSDVASRFMGISPP